MIAVFCMFWKQSLSHRFFKNKLLVFLSVFCPGEFGPGFTIVMCLKFLQFLSALLKIQLMIILAIVLLHLHYIFSMGKMLRIPLCPFQSEHKFQFTWKQEPCMYLRTDLLIYYLLDNMIRNSL